MAQRQIEYHDAKALRDRQEEDLVRGFEMVIGNAVSEVINDDVEKLILKMDEELQKKKDAATKERDSLIYEAIDKRWYTTHARKRKIDKTKVAQDFDKLMREGPTEFMFKVLQETKKPGGGYYTDTEAKALLADNEFCDKFQGEMIKQIIAKKFLTGGLRAEDIAIISMSSWGADFIDQALTLNTGVKSRIEQAFGAGALEKAGRGHRIMQAIKKDKKILLWFLAAFIGLPIALLAGAAKLTPQETELQTG